MILRTQDGEIAEDACTRGFWCARLTGDTEFTYGFQCRVWAAGWLHAAAFARKHGLPPPPPPSATTSPLYVQPSYTEKVVRR